MNDAYTSTFSRRSCRARADSGRRHQAQIPLGAKSSAGHSVRIRKEAFSAAIQANLLLVLREEGRGFFSISRSVRNSRFSLRTCNSARSSVVSPVTHAYVAPNPSPALAEDWRVVVRAIHRGRDRGHSDCAVVSARSKRRPAPIPQLTAAARGKPPKRCQSRSLVGASLTTYERATDSKSHARIILLTMPSTAGPKITALDLHPALVGTLNKLGVACRQGTLGSCYASDKTTKWVPIRARTVLKNYPEQEIVVFDMDAFVSDNPDYDGWDIGWQVKGGGGYVDPRPPTLYDRRNDSERIFKHGGVFVVFTAPRMSFNYARAGNSHMLDAWGILEHFDNLPTVMDSGVEITPETDRYGALVGKYLEEATFSVRLASHSQRTDFRQVGA